MTEITRVQFHQYLALQQRNDARPLPMKYGTAKDIVDQYWKLSGDTGTSVDAAVVTEWYEKEGWVWSKTLG